MAEELGFEAVDTGALTMARNLEPLALVWITLAPGQGRGRGFAFNIARRQVRALWTGLAGRKAGPPVLNSPDAVAVRQRLAGIWCRDRAELLHHAQAIGQTPEFGDFPVGNTENEHPVGRKRFAAGGHTHIFAFLRAA